MKREFQFDFGDRVRCVAYDTNHQTSIYHLGLTGTIFNIKEWPGGKWLFSVEHDEEREFLHCCAGEGPQHKCWNYYADELELLEEPPVVSVDDLI